MQLPQYTSQEVAQKRVLLRADLDIKGKVDKWHDLRLERLAPVIKNLLDSEVRQIILIGHRGRPQGKDETLSLEPVRKRLSELASEARVSEQIFFIDDINSDINASAEKKIIMLENLRFWPGEKTGDGQFAKALSAWGDVYINNAFANSHRADASMVALPKSMSVAYAGPGVVREVKELSEFFSKSAKPLLVVLGGAKISEKLDLLKLVLAKADKILLGGGLANNLLRAQGVNVGRSLVSDMDDKELTLITSSPKVVLPIDFIGSENDKQYQQYTKDTLTDNTFIGDIGPKTVELFKKEINRAKTILWNGPLSKYEDKDYSQGMFAVAQAIAGSKSRTVAGGAETVEVIETLGLTDKFSYISVGGGAMLTFLAGGQMPGIEALINR